MPSIVVDGGPLIALFDRDDRYHRQARAFLQRIGDRRLVTTSLVIGEVAAMLSDQPSDLNRFLDWLAVAVEIDDALHEDLPRIREIMRKYADLPADLADASLVALCERRSIDTVASIDSDFDVFRLSRGKRLVNIFFDEPR